ncbi:MAG TPA: sugar ABC transporter substrate-binding protein [Microbacterium sp.]|nr:sugar ABC transporter substrate-binding protein [Microbacterium sp.]
MRTKFKALAAVAIAAALTLTGCSSGGGGDGGGGGDATGGTDEPFKVIAFTSGNQTPVGAWWVKAVEAQAEELGWDLTMIQGDFDFQKMNPAVESAIGQGADVILNGYTDVASIGSIVTAAKDAEIPIFAIDSGTEPTDAFAINITTDQQGIVDSTLGAFDESLDGLDGKTIMVIGHDPHAGIRMRAGLAADDLEAAGATLAGGEIQKVTSPATGRTEALALVADFLTANPGGLDGVWVGWDDAALGAAQAITEAGATGKVTGVDAVSESIAAIEAEGAFLATVEQPWPSILDSLLEHVLAYQEDGTLPDSNFEAVGTTLVTVANAATITPSDQLE